MQHFTFARPARCKHIFSRWEPDPNSISLGTTFSLFDSPVGLSGLARATDTRVDVLAVFSTETKRGKFRRFLNLLLDRFETVCVLSVFNPAIKDYLLRQGFMPFVEPDESGDFIAGYRMVKEKMT